MQVKTVLVIEGIANLLMMAAKLGVGLVTNSAAIVGDALHSLTDLANNVIAFIATRISEKPSDDDHHYGHRKFEQLAVFGLAVLLAVVAIELVLNAIQNYGEVVNQSFVGLAVLAVTLLLNIGLTVWEHYWARRLDSDLLSADANHTLSDVLTTLAVIVGWQLAANGYYWIDTLFALLVAMIILFLAFRLFQRAVPILVDHSSHDPGELERMVQSIDRVEQVRQIRARSAQEGGWADVVVTMDPRLSIETSHRITEEIEQALEDHFGIKDVLVHVEPHPGDRS
ncbi:MAG: cation transporter [Gammaproteobacteria bacterium]|nr:cation transporter [Gammaproteobacteria bacterium]